MTTAIDTIKDDFTFLDDWEDRYRYLIELGADLPDFPDSDKTDANKVRGCVSQVWLTTRIEGDGEPVLHFAGDSDAMIVRGLVAVMLALYSGRSAREIIATDAEDTFKELGLDEHLTPQRANGLRAMVERIKREATQSLAQTG